MNIDYPHRFSVDEATSRIKALTSYWDSRYGTRTTWQGPSATITGKVKGIKFDGTFTVKDRSLVADVKVGFLAEKMGGRQYVEHKLQQYLDPATSLESLASR